MFLAVKTGNTLSCGCYNLERFKEIITTHGLYKSKKDRPLESDIWQRMKQCCLNPNNHAYKYYGGRGITVCDRWKNNFELFIEDMGYRPNRLYSIERIDVDGNLYINAHDPGFTKRFIREDFYLMTRKRPRFSSERYYRHRQKSNRDLFAGSNQTIIFSRVRRISNVIG